jgi:hypothetical protein
VSPLPSRDRVPDYIAKGAHLALRQLNAAPEQRRARHLASEVGTPPAPGSPRVAILTPRDWAVHVQWEGMIAQALRLRGADVRFITCGGGLEICDRANVWESPPMPCSTCHRYVEGSLAAHGFEQTPIRDGWIDRDPEKEDAWVELDATPADQLLELESLGLPLGRLVDIPTKWFLMGSQLADDPLGNLTVRRFLRSARRVVRGLESALDRLQPDVVLLLNGLFFFEAVCWALCRQRGIDVVSYERGLIKDTLLFQRGSPACLPDVTDAWERWKGVPLTAEENAELDMYIEGRQHGRRTIDRFWGDARFERPDRKTPGRLVVLFPNLTWDSAVIGQEVAFARIQDWLLAAVDAMAARPDDELIIRIHPAEAKLPGKRTREPIGGFLAARYPVLPPNVHIIDATDPTSSYPLMASCDVGLVLTSTTGVELALQGKPVIVAGNTHYRGKGFTVDVSSPAQFQAALDSVLADPAPFAPDPELVRRYAYLFFFRTPVDSPGVEEHILGLARITVRDVDELKPGVDPSLDRICDGILHGASFMP